MYRYTFAYPKMIHRWEGWPNRIKEYDLNNAMGNPVPHFQSTFKDIDKFTFYSPKPLKSVLVRGYPIPVKWFKEEVCN